MSTEPQNCVPGIFKLTQFLSFTGITPWYDFDTLQLVRPKTFKWYSNILAAVLAILTVTLAYIRYRIIFNGTSSFYMIWETCLDVESLIMILCMILNSCNWNMNSWANFYERYIQLDAYLKTISNFSSDIFILKNCSYVFILGVAYLFSIYQIYDSKPKNSTTVYFSASLILTFYEFLVAFTIYNITSLIRKTYMCLSELLCQCRFKPNRVQNIKYSKEIYLKIDDIVRIYENVFGWPLLFLFLDFCVNILGGSIMFACNNFSNKSDVEGEARVVVIFCFLQCGVWLTAIIFCCDSVVREADELLTNCYRLEQTLPLLSEEMEELESLKRLIKNKRPKLTAAGFFEIRRSTLLSLLSTTTTYFIVALQFNSL